MKCAKCGAQVAAGCVYCPVCGNEIQIVPDYSALEDDYLKELMSGETKNEAAKEPDKTRKCKKTKKKKYAKSKKKYILIGAAICILVILVIVGVCSVGSSYDAQMQKAKKAYEDKRYEDTITYTNKALKHNKKSTQALLLLAKAEIATKKEEDAISTLQKVIALEDTNEEAYSLILDLYLKNDDYEAIAKLYEQTEDAKIQALFEGHYVLPPSFSEKEGTYDQALDIEIESEEDLEIYYTTDGSDPKEDGVLYNSKIPFHEEKTYNLQAVCKNKDGIYSKLIKAEYTVEIAVPDLPKASPDSGTYTQPTQITIEVPQNCIAYYAWNGTPGSDTQKYEGAFDMIEGNNVLSVIIVSKSGETSGIQKYNYIYMP